VCQVKTVIHSNHEIPASTLSLGALYDAVVQKLGEVKTDPEVGCFPWRSALKELELHFGEDPMRFLGNQCWDFWYHPELDGSAQHSEMRDMFDGADINLKMHMDGGGVYKPRQAEVTVGGDTVHCLERKALTIDNFEAGPMERHRVLLPNELPSESHIVSNFGTCTTNAIYCCWVQDIQANDDMRTGALMPIPLIILISATLTCRELRNRPISFALYPGDSEGDAHCHGLAFSSDVLDITHLFKGNTISYISLADHLRDRGYAREVAGSPVSIFLMTLFLTSKPFVSCTHGPLSF
jgi:hypothetical protein